VEVPIAHFKSILAKLCESTEEPNIQNCWEITALSTNVAGELACNMKKAGTDLFSLPFRKMNPRVNNTEIHWAKQHFALFQESNTNE